jgi:hypothetical protein
LPSDLEATFLWHWGQLAPDAPPPEPEYRFAAMAAGPGRGLRARLEAANLRDWRFDFAWPSVKVAVECEGGVWSRGRHVRGAGFEGDCAKYNAAEAMHWRVFRCTAGMLKDDPAGFVEMVRRAIDDD